MLKAGKMPIYEPGLEEIVRRNDQRRAAELYDRSGVCGAGLDDRRSSPSARRRARTARPICSTCSASRATIGRAMQNYTVIVDKSTVPVGTAKKVRATIAARDHAAVQRRQQSRVSEAGRGDRRLHEARSRRHRRRRRATTRAAELMNELYGPFTRTGAPIMMMDTASAELCKYAANSILATRISFMNEIANVCELVGADVDHVRKAIGVGSPHRHVVSVSRRRLRRQLLSEGRRRRC